MKEVFQKDPVRGVDPMQCVAMGAAIQAGVMTGEVDKEILLLDVTPLTLGIETMGGVRTELIARNTTIPHKKSQIFSTAADNQNQVEIHVLQGERPMAADNKSLGKFILDGIPPAPRGVPQIEVTFDVDSNGILHVTAADKGTGKEQKITISGSSKLDDSEVERMKKEAEEHAADDEARKALVEARNQADQSVFQAKKLLEENADKLGEHKDGIEADVKELEELLTKEGVTAEELNGAMEKLSKTMEPAIMAMYQEAAAEAEAAQAASGDGATVDGEFEESEKKD